MMFLTCLARRLALAVAVASALGAGAAVAAPGWVTWRGWSGPCAGECAVAAYWGRYVENSMNDVLLLDPEPPTSWEYVSGDELVGATLSRRIATLWGSVDVEPEIGLARRYGRQDETEAWAAFYFRYRGFPWDGVVVNTVAISTGFNWASDVSEVEQERARDGEGSQWMHYFAPEITFALPRAPQYELLFRFHHRSGVFGVVSDAWGGAQYGSIGVRWRF